MRKTALRLFLFVLIGYLLAFLGTLLYQLLNYPDEQLLYMYRVPWLLEEALRSFIAILPTIHLSAILLSFATRTRQPGEAALEETSAALRKSLIVFMLFTLIFSGLNIGLQPLLHRHSHDRLYLSKIGMDYLKRAKAADEAGEIGTAEQLYRDYLTIDMDNDIIRDRADKLAGQMSAKQVNDTQADKEPLGQTSFSQYRNLSAAQLVEQGREKLEAEDPFTAHYMARLALELEPEREDAKRLASQAWQQIRELEPSRSEQRQHQLYSRKVAGYNALDRDRPIEAYYIFEQLRQELPNDPDVQEYYRISRNAASDVSFFLDEAQKTDTLPGVEQILYLEPREEPPSRAVYFDKLVRTRSGTWVHDAEIIDFTPGGEVLLHLTAEHGKIMKNSLILRGIHRTKQEQLRTPNYLAGSPPEAPAHIYTLSPSVGQLQLLGQSRDYFRRLSLVDLFKLEPVLSRFGYPRREVQVAVLNRLNEPFLFFVLSFFAAALGLRFRARRRRFPVLLLVAVPAVPAVIYALIEIYRYAFSIGFSLFVTLLGLSATLLIFLASQALLLFLGLLFIATFREP